MTVNGVLNTIKEETIRRPYTVNLYYFRNNREKITIDAARFDASIAKVTHVDDPFEAFFNGGSNYVEAEEDINDP